MIVVDIETSGIEPTRHSILSIGAVDFNDISREFNMDCRVFDGAHIDQDALDYNGFIKEQITNPSKPSEGEIVKLFLDWAKESSDHTLAGQNPSFDLDFLKAAAHRAKLDISIPKRTVDLHSVCLTHMILNKVIPPIKNNRSDLDSDTIMQYVGISPEPRPHVAINGARIETEAFARLFYNKNILPEYKDFKIIF